MSTRCLTIPSKPSANPQLKASGYLDLLFGEKLEYFAPT